MSDSGLRIDAGQYEELSLVSAGAYATGSSASVLPSGGTTRRGELSLITSTPSKTVHAKARLWTAEWCRPLDAAVALAVLLAIVMFASDRAIPSDLSGFLGLRVSVKNAMLLVLFGVLWSGALTITGAYDADRAASFRQVMVSVAGGCALGSVFVFFLPLMSTTGLLGVLTAPVLWIFATLGTVMVRFGARTAARIQRSRTAPRRVVIAGTGARAETMWATMRQHPLVRYHLIAVSDVSDARVSEVFRGVSLIEVNALDRFFMHTSVDEVHVALPVKSRYREIQRILQTCESGGVNAQYLADAFSSTFARPRIGTSGDNPAMAMHVVSDNWQLRVKRAIDVVGALAGLLILAPVMMLVALSVTLGSPGPAIFSHERYGFRKRRFTMFKFRTMVVNAEQLQDDLENQNEVDGPVFKIRYDPRVTRIGRFLRRASLDELPQLWNVLTGDMSLVGPRPLPMRDIERFDDPALMRRFSVRPGCTGLWQVSGRSGVGFEQWMALDFKYIDSWSLWLDLSLLVKSVPAVLFGRGAH